MSDTRQALEEAWEHLCQTSLSFRRYACTTIPGGDGWTMTGRFCRFLDAEAWTDAAMMLVPEGKGFCIMGNAAKVGKHVGVGETPALALAQACLKARENGDG